MRSTNSSRRLIFASVSRSRAWSDFFSDENPVVPPTAGPSTSSSSHRCRERAAREARLRQIRMGLDQGSDPGRHLRGETTLRPRPIAHPLWLSARLALAEDLLHIPKTYSEYNQI